MISYTSRLFRARPCAVGGARRNSWFGRQVWTMRWARRIIANIALAVMAIAASEPASAASHATLPGPIEARVLRVLDGDTIEVAARIWLEQDLTVRVRLLGIDAPEMKAHCARERDLALRARDLVAGTVGGEVSLTQIQYDKYGGRVVARVAAADGRDLSDALIASGLAHRYDGGKKRPWCETAER
jgi:micrococcal nuclease